MSNTVTHFFRSSIVTCFLPSLHCRHLSLGRIFRIDSTADQNSSRASDSFAYRKKQSLKSKAIVFVAQTIDEWVHTAADECQYRQTVMSLSIKLYFSRHRQCKVDLARRQTNDQHQTRGTYHARHFPAKFGLALC